MNYEKIREMVKKWKEELEKWTMTKHEGYEKIRVEELIGALKEWIEKNKKRRTKYEQERIQGKIKERIMKNELEKWMEEHPGEDPPQLIQLRKDIQAALNEMSEKEKTFTCKECGETYIATTPMQMHECHNCGAIQH